MLVQGVEHKIETLSDPPFRPIYNLLGCKLAAFYKYIKTAF